jgi:hypothetical protein
MSFFQWLYVVFWIGLFEHRVVLVVDTNGDEYLRRVRLNGSGLGYVIGKRNTVGFLDNLNQWKGEFRKGISSPGMVRWLEITL